MSPTTDKTREAAEIERAVAELERRVLEEIPDREALGEWTVHLDDQTPLHLSDAGDLASLALAEVIAYGRFDGGEYRRVAGGPERTIEEAIPDLLDPERREAILGAALEYARQWAGRAGRGAILQDGRFVPARGEVRRESRDLLWTGSAGIFHGLRDALAKGDFHEVEGSPWPRARIGRGEAKGFAELRPITPIEQSGLPPEEINALAERMWQQREELSDTDADVLDAVSARWIDKAKTPGDLVTVMIDDILEDRGIAPKTGAGGRRSGYRAEQRAEVYRSLWHLDSVWLQIADAVVYEGKRKQKLSIESRAFLITDRVGQKRLDGSMDVKAVNIMPGRALGKFLIGEGRQLALLSANALRYHARHQWPEKRLARYLSWQWRIGASEGKFLRSFRVETLLSEIGLEVNRRDPGRTRARLEKALETLQEHSDLAAWQYGDEWSEDRLPRQGWLPQWLAATVVVEAPDLVKDAYRNLDKYRPAPRAVTAGEVWAEKLRETRKARKLTQMQAAEEIGITQGQVSNIERGRVSPGPTVRRRLEKWLRRGD